MKSHPADPSVAFLELVTILREGQRLPRSVIVAALTQAGRTDSDLVDAVLVAPEQLELPPQPGDACECGGTIQIYTSRLRGSVYVQYLRCDKCHRRPGTGKRVVPAWTVRRRRRENRSN